MNENIDLYNADAETLVRCASMKSVWRERWEKGDGEDLQAWLDTPSPKSIRTSRSLRASSPTRLPSAEDAMKRVSIKRTALAWYISSRLRPADIEARARASLSKLQPSSKRSRARSPLREAAHHPPEPLLALQPHAKSASRVFAARSPRCMTLDSSNED